MLWRLGCASLILAAILLGATGWTVYTNWADARGDAERTRVNRAYLRDLNEIVEDLKDAETGQRGYLLTGRESYLRPYTEALRPIEESLKSLSEIAKQRPSQRAIIEHIRDETHTKLREMVRTIDLRKAEGLDAALEQVLTDRGRASMDEIRKICNSASEDQYADMLKRSADAASHQQNAILIAAGGGFLILSLMVGGFLTLISGANQQTQLAERLAVSREIFETTLTSIGDGVVATDTQGRVTFLNPEAARLTGWPRKEATGKHLDEIFRIVNETSRANVESPFDKVMRTGAVVGLANHTTLIRPDGSELSVDDSGAPIRDEHGKINGVVLVFRDIGERRKSEAALELSHSEVLKANEELRQFTYAATHDLQEPLRTIVVFSQLLGRGYWQVLDQRGQHLLQTVEEAAHRMSLLIDDLLAYSRADGVQSPNSRVVNPTDTLKDTLLQLHGAVVESGAVITHSDLPRVWSDPAQLSQVFQNLISNAIKYRRAGVAPAIHVSATLDGSLVTFQIADNGMGFKQEYSDKIFQLFQRLHGRSIPGTGIGLALCRRIVERQGGRIWARSEENAGTSFYFTLPAAMESERHPE